MKAFARLASTAYLACLFTIPGISTARAVFQEGPALLAHSESEGMAATALARYQTQNVAWSPCPEHAGVECATLEVPADYQRPSREAWRVAIARLRSTSEGSRLGVLVINPGGPGIPGVPELTYSQYWAALRTRYDIVSFDPRGVGTSSPEIACLTEAEKAAIRNQVSDPTTPEQTRLARRLGRMQGTACFRKYGWRLRRFGTRNVARDMDILRGALGEEKLSYLGFSYGTYLGAVYADMFPGRTERMVLDSAMNPALPYRELRHGQALGFQSSIQRFVADCPKHFDCPLPSGEKAGLAALKSLVAALDDTPYQGPDGRLLSGSRTLGLIESSMYFPADGWPGLRKVLKPALDGDYQPLLQMTYSPALMVNPADSPYLTVMCHDLQTTHDVWQPQRLARKWVRQATITGAGRAWSLQACETWPVESGRQPKAVSAKGSGSILIVAGQHDPATPIDWARSLHRALAHSALLEWTGDGHIMYGMAGDCMSRAVEDFLLKGELPPEGRVCD